MNRNPAAHHLQQPATLMKTMAFLIMSCATLWILPVRGEISRAGGEKTPLKEVAAVLFVDIGNAQCANVERDLEAFAKAKGVTLQTVVKHAPSQIDAVEAHEALEAARAQGKFREMEELLFQKPEARGRGLVQMAAGLGMNARKFEDAMDDRSYRWLVLRDLTEARGLGIRSTPTLFVDGTRLEGFEAIGSALHPPATKPPPQWADLPVETLALDFEGSPSNGLAHAPVTIVEFTDFRCGFCRVNSRTLSDLEKAFPGKIRRIFKNFPLSSEDAAVLPHAASLAALEQGRFWEIHHALMNRPLEDRADLLTRAGSLGLDTNRFATALVRPQHRSLVARDIAEGEKLGIQATPTTFINGRRVVGRQSLETLKMYVTAAMGPGVATKDAEAAAISAENTTSDPDSTGFGSTDAPVLVEAFINLGDGDQGVIVRQLRDFVQERPGVRVEFRHFPSPANPGIVQLHEAAMAAAEQGRFWEMSELILVEPKVPDTNRLMALAQFLKLDTARYEASLREHRHAGGIQADLTEGKERGLQHAAILMNGTLFDGNPTVQNLARHMDENACCGKTSPPAQRSSALARIPEHPAKHR